MLLLHGFPDLPIWRNVMPALAEAGYHVIAPDQCGYGRTTGWKSDYDGGLIHSGCSIWCALMRSDVFRSVALMSAPFVAPLALPLNTADAPRFLRTRLAVYRASQRSIGIAAPGLTREK